MKNNRLWVPLVFVLVALACNATAAGTPAVTPTATATSPVLSAVTLAIAAPSISPSPTLSLTPTTAFTKTLEPAPGLIPHVVPGGKITLMKIDMIDRLNGWGIGGAGGPGLADHIFRTIDGGQKWQDVTPPEYANPASASPKMAAGWFTNSEIAWVIFSSALGTPIPAAPVVWQTSNGGASWKSGAPLGIPAGAQKFQVAHLAFSTRFGWLLVHTGDANGQDLVALYITTDSGATWAQTINPSSGGEIQTCQKTGLIFVDSVHGLITGNCQGAPVAPFLFRSLDGGTNWTKIDLASPPEKPDLFTVPRYACGISTSAVVYASDKITAVGVECKPQGTTTGPALEYLYYSTDMGISWTVRSYPGGSFLYVDHTAWALGRDIYVSKDNAATWTKITSIDWDGQFDFVTEKEGWAVGSKDKMHILYQTKDGGASWTTMDPIVAG
jgi:hypothetical protein